MSDGKDEIAMGRQGLEDVEHGMDGQIQIRRDNIPVKAVDLAKFVMIGKEALKAQKAKLRAIQKADMAYAAKAAALADAQDVAEVVLDAEARLGEILAETERRYVGSLRGTNVPQQKKTLPDGVTKKDSHRAQQLYRHPDVVEQCKAEAREKGEIVTSQAVLREVQQQKAAEDGSGGETESEMDNEADTTMNRRQKPRMTVPSRFAHAVGVLYREVEIIKERNWRGVNRSDARRMVNDIVKFIDED